MSDQPLRIGLSARLMHSPPAELGFHGKTLQYLEQSLAHWIMNNGAIAFMIPTMSHDGILHREAISLREIVASLDGLVLQGGADVSPESYGEHALRPEWGGDRIRDLFEIELVWEFIIQNKPVLGICRGAQLINVACGGTLYQDIFEQFPDAVRHRDDELYDGLHHAIDIVATSRLASLYPDDQVYRVNSIHHQAIKKLGDDLTVEAISSDDGLIEAIRWTGTGFMFGCQWHPELQAGMADLLDSSPIMLDFLEAARKSKLHLAQPKIPGKVQITPWTIAR